GVSRPLSLFTAPPPADTYPLSLHDALPIFNAPVHAQSSPTAVIDDSIPPGANFDQAQFRLWTPAGVERYRAVLVLVPGSNGDGRSEEHTSELQSLRHLVCRLLLEKKTVNTV